MEEMAIEDAKKKGAMALFGEKYGDTVRVVAAEDFSVEFCGGTHIDNTSKVGLFKVVSESSVAAGVRRITGVTGSGVLELLESYKNMVLTTAAEIKVSNVNDITAKAKQLIATIKEQEKEIAKLEDKLASGKMDELLNGAVETEKALVIAKVVKNMDANGVRTLCDNVKASKPNSICVFAVVSGEKLTFVAACGSDAVKNGCHAGNIVREVAKIAGGNGGGRPDSAMAGGKDVSKAEEAISKVMDIING
jgi:alanyl-tRNA synthetase